MLRNLEKELYFVAIVPQEPLYSQALELKHYFAEHYNSKKALNSPPHITLRMPFKFRPDRESKIIAALEEVTRGQKSFIVDINGFGFFEPRVIYLKVADNTELAGLFENVNKIIRQNLKIVNELGDRPFRPHMTVAFRDLRKPRFYEAKTEFEDREFRVSFKVNDICLLKHNGKCWEVLERINLAKN